MKDKKEFNKKEEIEWICIQNRTGDFIDNLPEIAGSGLRLYERKLDLNYCRLCDNNTTHNGKKYCLLNEQEYKIMNSLLK